MGDMLHNNLQQYPDRLKSHTISQEEMDADFRTVFLRCKYLPQSHDEMQFEPPLNPETKLPEKEVNRMTKNTRFSPRSVNGQFVWFWKVRANMTHNGRQFVPLPQRLAVRQRLCVCGFVSMSGIREW